MPVRHRERHRTEHTGWLRAAVLGANDGILSTASLVLGVAAAHGTRSNVLVAGVAGMVAGAMSMAAGEYVSVHSQADTEQADLARERAELRADDKGEHKELMAIYVGRGLDPSLAEQVADQLMAHDAMGAHARDELGMSETLRARPIQAALASAGSFAVGASLPLFVTALAPEASLIIFVSGHFTALSGTFGCVGRVRGRRKCHPKHNTRHVLGRAGDGDNRRRRGIVRNRRISGPGDATPIATTWPIPSRFFSPRKPKISALIPSRLRLDRQAAPSPSDAPVTAPPTSRSDRPGGLPMTSDSGPEREFWQIALADLERQLGAGRNGLTSAEAGARRLRYGPNTLEERRRLSLPLKFLSRFRNPLVIILLAAAVISALTGDLTSFIIISTIVLMSAALDTVQEFRAEQAAESLKVSEARRWPSRTREIRAISAK